jgi:alpha-1,3-rhamnosyl/mannosyltransferase
MVEALVAVLGLSGTVRTATVGVPDELAALLSAARWGIYPSLYEGFGLPPLEAMRCGLPMIVSDRTACPEVVGDGAALVDPEDIAALAGAMRRMEEDPEWREELRARGRRRAESPAFSWERAARQTIAVYRGDRAAHAAEPDPLRTEAPALAGAT